MEASILIPHLKDENDMGLENITKAATAKRNQVMVEPMTEATRKTSKAVILKESPSPIKQKTGAKITRKRTRSRSKRRQNVSKSQQKSLAKRRRSLSKTKRGATKTSTRSRSRSRSRAAPKKRISKSRSQSKSKNRR